MALHMGLNSDSVYLWTLPMFHCNGWCFPWAVTAMGGVHLCLPKVDAGGDLAASARSRGSAHFCAAPTVLTMTIWDPDAGKALVAGCASRPAARRRRRRCSSGSRQLGMDITHLYGLTETYGPSVICDWRSEWNSLPHRRAGAAQGAAGRGQRRSASRCASSTRTAHDVPADGNDDGRDRDTRQQRDARLLPRRRSDAQSLPGRLVPDRRPRRHACGRLRRAARSRQGHHHLRRREHLVGRGRAGAHEPSRGARGRRRRGSRREMGRGSGRLRHAQGPVRDSDRDAS